MFTSSATQSRKVLTFFSALALAVLAPIAYSSVYAGDYGSIPSYDGMNSVDFVDAVDAAGPVALPDPANFDQDLYALDGEALLDAVDASQPAIEAPNTFGGDVEIYSMDGPGLLDAVDGE